MPGVGVRVDQREPEHGVTLRSPPARGAWTERVVVVAREEPPVPRLDDDLAVGEHGLAAHEGPDDPGPHPPPVERRPRVLRELLALRVDHPLRLEVVEGNVGVGARLQRPLARVEAGDPGGVRRREADERVERHSAAVVGLVEHERHRLLDHLAAEERVEDVHPARLLLVKRVGRVVGDEAVGRPVEHGVPQPLHERALAQRRGAHPVRAEPHEIVEVEQQVVRADLHRRGPPLGLLAPHEIRADRARHVDDLDPHAGVRREEERAVHRLLLDERRPRLVVGQRVATARSRHPRQPVLEQRIALGMDEHESSELLHAPHPFEELGVGDVWI